MRQSEAARRPAARLPAAALLVLASAAFAAEVSPSQFTGVHWQLVRLRGDSVPNWGTLKVGTNGEVNGRAGCNAMAGRAAINGDRVAFQGVFASFRPCSSEAMTRFQGRYTGALGQVARWRVENGRLYLRGKDGNDLLVFGHAEDRIDVPPVEESADPG